jgi:hypothetical protein
MSSTATSSSNFQSIFDAALTDYAKLTHIDLTTHPFAQTLQNCDSVDAILALFQDKAIQFQEFRDGNRKLIDRLKPIVQFLHTIAGILDSAATLVSLPDRPVLSHPVLMVLHPGTIPTYKDSPRWRRCPPYGVYGTYIRLYRSNMPVLDLYRN